LLEAARAARPEAFIAYKPHPDVLAGHRRGAIDAADVARLADQLVVDAPIGACLDESDTLFTLTSLTGFEALLHGLEVECLGRPFYAGWGLTRDHASIPRRTRQRQLDELVAATLIRYPRYVHPQRRAFTSPETIVELLRQQRARGGRPRPFARWRNLLEGISRAR